MTGERLPGFAGEDMRKTVLIECASVLGVALCCLQSVSGQEVKATVVVKPLADSPTGGIQEAIDSLNSEGGIVSIPAGEYLLRQSIRLRYGITLQGSGETSVLRKNKQFGSKLTATNAGKTIQVKDASGFQAGDEIGLFDRTSVGWLHGHAVIVEVKGNELILNKNPGASSIHPTARPSSIISPPSLRTMWPRSSSRT